MRMNCAMFKPIGGYVPKRGKLKSLNLSVDADLEKVAATCAQIEGLSLSRWTEKAWRRHIQAFGRTKEGKAISSVVTGEDGSTMGLFVGH